MTLDQVLLNTTTLSDYVPFEYKDTLLTMTKRDFYNPALRFQEVPNVAGVFMIRHKSEDKIYVGTGSKVGDVVRTIRNYLFKDNFRNSNLQALFNQYSNLDFELYVIPVEDDTIRSSLAEEMITTLNTKGTCLNTNVKAKVRNVTKVNKTNYACYTIKHLPTGKFYIGSAKNGESRWKAHQWALNRQKHNNNKFQALWNTDSDLNNWTVMSQFFSTREKAYQVEKTLLDLHWGKNDLLLNISPETKDHINALMTPEVRAKAIASITATSRLPQNRDATAARFKAMWSDPNRRSAIAGGGNPFAKGIIVDGIKYGSVKEAQAAVSKSEKTLRKLANDPKCLTVVWADLQNVTVPKVVSVDNGVPKSISIKGVVYSSVAAAIRAIGGSPKTWRDRANSESCSDVFWV